MKSKINQYAKMNNMEVAQVYLELVPITFFISLLVVTSFVFSPVYSVAAIAIVGIVYLTIKCSLSIKDSFMTLFELVLSD